MPRVGVVQALRLAGRTGVQLNPSGGIAGGQQVATSRRRHHRRAVWALAPQAEAGPAQRTVGRCPLDVANGFEVAHRPTDSGRPVEDLVVDRVGLEVLAVHGPVQVGDKGGVAHTAAQPVVLPVVVLHL